MRPVLVLTGACLMVLPAPALSARMPFRTGPDSYIYCTGNGHGPIAGILCKSAAGARAELSPGIRLACRGSEEAMARSLYAVVCSGSTIGRFPATPLLSPGQIGWFGKFRFAVGSDRVTCRLPGWGGFILGNGAPFRAF